MTRLTPRHWFGLVVVVAFVAMGYALLRPRPDFSPTPVTNRPPSVKPLSSDSGPGEWAMDGYNPARTRATDSNLALPLAQKHELQIPPDPTTGSPITVAQNTLFVETEDKLSALDLSTGKKRWSIYENGKYVSPAVAGDTVYLRVELSNKGTVFALDLATAAERWRFSPRRISTPATNYWGGHLTSPVVSGGKVFVGAGQEVYALDAATGAVRWEYGASDLISSSATVADGRVFISDAQTLYALDQDSGKLLWKAPIKFAVYFAPIVANGTVFVTSGKNLLALSAADGSKRWEAAREGETLLPAAVQGDRVFAKSATTLRALDVATGRDLWRSEHANYLSFPAVAADKLFVVAGSTGQTKLIAIDAATGKSAWEQRVPSLSATAPVIAGQTVYVKTTDGRVLGFSR